MVIVESLGCGVGGGDRIAIDARGHSAPLVHVVVGFGESGHGGGPVDRNLEAIMHEHLLLAAVLGRGGDLGRDVAPVDGGEPGPATSASRHQTCSSSAAGRVLIVTIAGSRSP